MMPKCRGPSGKRGRRKTASDAASDLILANLSPAVRSEGLASDTGNDGYANKAERSYAAHLEILKRKGEIKEWWYEPIRLRISDLKRGRRAVAAGRSECWYTPDFVLLLNDNRLVIHEIKGREEAATMVRFRIAAALHPYRFVLVKRDGQGWAEEVFEGD